jgi:hypothetical protein
VILDAGNDEYLYFFALFANQLSKSGRRFPQKYERNEKEQNAR